MKSIFIFTLIIISWTIVKAQVDESSPSISKQLSEENMAARNHYSVSTNWSIRSNLSTTSFLSLGLGYALNSSHEVGAKTHMDASESKYAGWSAYWKYKKQLAISPLFAILEANYTSLYYQLRERFGLGALAGIEFFFTDQVGLNIFLGAEGIDRAIPPFSLLNFSTLYNFNSGVSVVYVF